MNNVLSFIIEARDKATATLSKIKATFSELGEDWKKAMSGMKEGSYSGLLSFAMKVGPALAKAGAAVAGLGASIRWLGEGLADYAKLETYTIRLSKITGSLESAREAMRALTEGKDSVKDLFGDEDVLQAAIALRRLSAGALGSAADIKVLAGAAYDTGQPISQVAQDVGVLTGMITEGVTGWERYAKGLARAGVLSFETIKQMTDMKEAGKSAGDIVAFMWDAINQQHSGSIDAARNSIEGLHKAANEAFADMKRNLGEIFGKDLAAGWYRFVIAFSDSIKGIVNGFIGVGDIITGVLTGQTPKQILNNVLDRYDANNRQVAEAPSGNLKDNINSKSGQSDEQKAAAKAAADARGELIDARNKAEAELRDAGETARQRQKRLQDERSPLAFSLSFPVPYGQEKSDERIAAETRLLQIDKELLDLKKEIADQDKKAADTAEAAAKKAHDAQVEAWHLQDQAQADLQDAKEKQQAYLDSKKPVDEQLRIVEAKIRETRALFRAETDPGEKARLADDYYARLLPQRDRLQKQQADDAKERADKVEQAKKRIAELQRPSVASLDVSQEFAWRNFAAGRDPLSLSERASPIRSLMDSRNRSGLTIGGRLTSIQQIGEASDDFKARTKAALAARIAAGKSPEDKTNDLLTEIRDLQRIIRDNVAPPKA